MRGTAVWALAGLGFGGPAAAADVWLDRPHLFGQGAVLTTPATPLDSSGLAGEATPVPLPPVVWPAAAALGAVWYFRRRRSR